MRFFTPSTRFARLVLLFLCSAVASAGRAQSDSALLWKISGRDLPEPSYLFGTYHLLTDSYFNTLPETVEPFKAAKGVVVETVIDSSRIGGLAGLMLMPDKKMSQLLSTEDFKLVSDELTVAVGVGLSQLDQMKPFTISMLMILSYAQRGNAATLARYPGKPMDYFVAASGKRQSKKVTQLETMEEQFELLYNAFSIEEQVRQLVAIVNQKELAATSQVRLLELYLAKDLGGLHTYAESMPKDFGNSDFLLKNRNEKWMRALPALMKKEAQFVAVGALHLPGPDGLLPLLRKAGYTVTPVNN